MSKFIITLVIAAATLVGCNDGRSFTKDSQASYSAVENILSTYETMGGKTHAGMGGALLHELRYHPNSMREGKWYVVGDHYSVQFKSSAHGLIFSVARDH